MSGWDGNGNLILPYSWVNDAANAIPITASRMDTQEATIATTGFGNCITRDNQGKPSANLLPDADNAYTLGGISYRWSAFYAVSLTVDTGKFNTALGVGMAPTNIVDVTQSGNIFSRIQIQNTTSGTAAGAVISSVNNSGSFANLYMLSSGYTTSGTLRADGTLLQNTGGGGLTIENNNATPIYFSINSTEVGRFGNDGSFLVGTTVNGGAGVINQHVYTAATLPTASGVAGSRSFVSDANATTFNSIVAGGGANYVPVFSDGTNWRIG